MTEGMNGFMNLRPAAVVAAALASLFVAAPALAKKLEVESQEKDHVAAAAGSACAERVFSRVFASFHDRSLYTSAPDGDFEGGASGWELGDGAAIVDESSSIQLADALG